MADFEGSVLTPLDALESTEEYRLYARQEIIQVLKGLAKKPEVVTAYLDGQAERCVFIQVLEVQSKEGRVIFDCGSSSTEERELRQASRLICMSKHDRVDINFECGPLSPASHEGHSAYAADLPGWVVRMQRREFFRVATLVAAPVRCAVECGAEACRFEVLDISMGGIGMMDREQAAELAVGDELRGCVLELPDFGQAEIDLEVRNLIPYTRSTGESGRRIGLAYLSLTNTTQGLLQRYINHLQLRSRDTAGE